MDDYGLQVYNKFGSLQTTPEAFNFIQVDSGTVSVGSNSGSLGMGGTRQLPANPTGNPYVVAIQSSGFAAIVASTQSNFRWFMAQGTTSFSYTAFNVGVGLQNDYGMQVFRADGSVQWDMRLRPLAITSIQPLSGLSESAPAANPGNTLGPIRSVSIPSGSAVMPTNIGVASELFYPFIGTTTVISDARYILCYQVSGSTCNMQWMRFSADRTDLPPGISRQLPGYTVSPRFLISTPII